MWSAMRRLMLLRHAKSDWSEPGVSDHDRPLNPRGQESAPKVGAYMARHGLVPDQVVCSTAVRARETWEELATEFKDHPLTVYDERLYNARIETILGLVRETKDRVKSLLLVGHNPGLHELAGLLIASGDLTHRARLREKLPTAGLVVIDFAVEEWTRLHPHAGRLERFVAPRWLETATD
jgi:phosphohistidine phosphatase